MNVEIETGQKMSIPKLHQYVFPKYREIFLHWGGDVHSGGSDKILLCPFHWKPSLMGFYLFSVQTITTKVSPHNFIPMTTSNNICLASNTNIFFTSFRTWKKSSKLEIIFITMMIIQTAAPHQLVIVNNYICKFIFFLCCYIYLIIRKLQSK